MLQRILLSGLALVVLGNITSVSQGQVSNTLVSQAEAGRFGLERAWFTRIQFDRARGRIAHLRQHVSSKYSYTVYEIESEKGRTVITDRDLDRFGNPLGKEEAARQAQRVVLQLTRAGLKPEMKTRVIPEVMLCVVSDTGVVQSIDAETGRTRWVASVGNPRFPVEAPGMNDDYVAIVNGVTTYLLNQATGDVVWQRRALGAPGAGVALSDTYAFVPMISGTIEAYRLDDATEPPWVFQAHGHSTIQPTVIGSVVAWPTDLGHVNVVQAESNAALYRLETSKSITAPVAALPPDRIIIVSNDGFVYCIRENNGSLLWSFSSGEPIVEPAVVIGESVFVVTQDDHLYCLAGETGLERWPAPIPRIRELISASPDRVYCLSDTGRMVIFDSRTGDRLGSLATESLDLHLVNAQTDRLILGSTNGVIQCLREARSPWPSIREGVVREAPQPEQRPRSTKPAGEEATEPAEPSSTDPFATPGGAADPFGAPGADPFGAAPADAGTPPPASGADPFADPFGS